MLLAASPSRTSSMSSSTKSVLVLSCSTTRTPRFSLAFVMRRVSGLCWYPGTRGTVPMWTNGRAATP
eukprot:206303-Rhodomonas_salina.2